MASVPTMEAPLLEEGGHLRHRRALLPRQRERRRRHDALCRGMRELRRVTGAAVVVVHHRGSGRVSALARRHAKIAMTITTTVASKNA